MELLDYVPSAFLPCSALPLRQQRHGRVSCPRRCQPERELVAPPGRFRGAVLMNTRDDENKSSKQEPRDVPTASSARIGSRRQERATTRASANEGPPPSPAAEQANVADVHSAVPNPKSERNANKVRGAPRRGSTDPPRKPRGYWSDISNLRKELEDFRVSNGLPAGEMPTARQLRASNRRDLDNAITNAGGYRAVRRMLGLASDSARKPRGYWNDFDNVARELRDFVKDNPCFSEERMPSQSELRVCKRADLQQAIDLHGGFIVVGERLGLDHASNRRPGGYWKDFEKLADALREYVVTRDAAADDGASSASSDKPARGGIGWMPTQQELRQSGRADLAQAISEFHGGYANVAEQLGFKSRTRDWSEFYMLAREIYKFLREEQGDVPVMVTSKQLSAYGRTDMLYAITRYGGMTAVAERLGLQHAIRTRAAFRDWNTFYRALLAFAEAHGRRGHLPSSRELLNFSRRDLYHAVLYHGGPRKVAERTGLVGANFWQEFYFVGSAVLDFIGKHGTEGVMPTESEFTTLGQRTLSVAVGKFGYEHVSARLGLKKANEGPRFALSTLTQVSMSRSSVETIDDPADVDKTASVRRPETGWGMDASGGAGGTGNPDDTDDTDDTDDPLEGYMLSLADLDFRDFAEKPGTGSAVDPKA